MKKCSVSHCPRPSDRLGFCTLHYMRHRRHGDPLAGRTPKGDLMRFLNEAVESETDECIIWPFSVAPSGYGHLKFRGGMTTAHRAALILSTGVEPPRDVHAAHCPHSCSDRRCVNPRHLRWASAVENEADKNINGQRPIGEKNGNASFTSEQVRVIRGLKSEHWKIAAAFQVSVGCIDAIMTGRTYKDVK
jgi:hypothetical protein